MAFGGRGPDSAAVSGPYARIIHDRLSSRPSTPSSSSYPSPFSPTSDLRSRPPSYSEHENTMHGLHRMPSTSSIRPRPLPVPPTPQPVPLSPSMSSHPPTPLPPSRPSSASSMATSFSFRPLPTVPVPILDPALPPRAKAAPLDLTTLAPHAGPLSPDAVSPLSPRGPPPLREMRRQNLSKLRRHLGQSVPPALVYRKSTYSSGDSSEDEGESTEKITFRVHLEQEDEVDETRREGGEQAAPGPRPVICEAEAVEAGPLWMREQNGKRWAEEDFGEILHALRNLR